MSGAKLIVMAPSSKDEQRRERLQEFEAHIARAAAAVGALALIVQGREARAMAGDPALEVAFAAAGVDRPPLPAGLWVALRRGDVGMALQLLAGVSGLDFVVGEREEVGSGYRLETVEETRPLPDVDLLQTRLAATVDIPYDVMSVLAEWGPEDPRTRAEVDALLDSRFGPARDAAAPSGPGQLAMSADELAGVLQLTPPQAAVLATLARRGQLAIGETGADPE